MRLKVEAGAYPLSDEELARIEDLLNLAAERGKKYIPFGDGNDAWLGHIHDIMIDEDFEMPDVKEIQVRSKRWNNSPMVNVEDFEESLNV